MRLECEIKPRQLAGADHAVPADAARMQKVEQVAPDVENTGALRPKQPFVAVGRKKINRQALHVERQDAQPLNGVDKEIDAALATQGADRGEIVAKAARVFDVAEADE